MNCSAPRSSASPVARSARRRSNPSPRGCGAKGKNVAVIPIGASIPLGALGFVRAVEETKSRLEAIDTRIDYVFHSSSSGGTQAGIVAGCQLFDWRGVKVVGVSSDDLGFDLRGGRQDHPRRRRGARRAIERRRDGVDDYVGAGYGVPSPQGDEAIELLARTEA